MGDSVTKLFKWTVMIYLAGDNNLTDECVHALTQMKEVERLDEVCILAQFDPKGGRLKSHRYKISNVSEHPSVSGDFKEWKANKKKFKHKYYRDYTARRNRNSSVINKDEETNTGSPVTLFDFVTWGIEKYKAENYILVLSGHGGGTEKGYLLRDEHPADALTIWEMQVALEAIKEAHGVEIDILGMDCCMMTMAEVSYQLKGLAKLIVGSEGYSPIAGWPFKPILKRMHEELRSNTGDEDPKQRTDRERLALASGIVEEYVNFYLDYAIGGLSVEMSALDLTTAKVDHLKAKIDELAVTLRGKLSDTKFTDAVVLAHWRAQSFNGEQFVDLYDFCGLLAEACSDAEVKRVCKGVLSTEAAFVPKSCYSGPDYQHAHGLSIYFPWAEISSDYHTVRFAHDYSVTPARPSAWLAFLEEYVVKTRREQRHEGNLFGDNADPYSVRHAPGRHAPGKSMLPEILSMRNPPLASGLSPCIKGREEKEEALKSMSAELQPNERFKLQGIDPALPSGE